MRIARFATAHQVTRRNRYSPEKFYFATDVILQESHEEGVLFVVVEVQIAQVIVVSNKQYGRCIVYQATPAIQRTWDLSV